MTTQYLAPETTLYRLVKDHQKDDDCIVDPATLSCIACNADHSDICPACNQRAFHTTDCPIYCDVMSYGQHENRPILVPDSEDNIGGYPDAPMLLYMAVMLALAAWLTEIGLHLHN